jgi:hypothetical protein
MCMGVKTDGARALTKEARGLSAVVKSPVDPLVVSCCCIHRVVLTSKYIPTDLQNTLSKAVKIIIIIKNRASNTRPFRVLFEEMGSDDTQLLLHTETRWLSRGKLLTASFRDASRTASLRSGHCIARVSAPAGLLRLCTVAYLARCL